MHRVNSKFASIKFKCVFKTKFGEVVKICGNIEEFGCWKPENALLMETTKDTYPSWKSTTDVILPVGMKFIYKYIICSTINNSVFWEVLPNNANREYYISAPGDFILNDEEGKVSQIYIERINPEIDSNNNNDFDKDSDFDEEVKQQELLSNLSYDNNQFSRYDINDTLQFSFSQKMNPDDRVIIATVLLPFNVVRGNGKKKFSLEISDENLIYSVMFKMKETNICDVIWVGMLRNFHDYTDDELNEIDEFLQERNIYVIRVTEIEYRDFWTYINCILTPIFVSNTYDMSKLFGKMIYMHMQENDLIMVNDIHLMFVPNDLLTKNSNARVGIYFHMAFPSSDVLKSFPHHQELLKSVLLCDVIGFHVYSLAHNFMTSCKRIFGIFYKIKFKGFITFDYLGRVIIIHIMHAGLDTDYIKSVISTESFKNKRKEFSELVNGKYSLVSQDVYSESSGILHKLEAYNRFLGSHDNVRNKIILVQLIHKNIEDGNFDQQIEDQVNILVKEITEQYGNNVLKLIEVKKPSIAERLALFSVGSCILYLQMREGNCMYADEFILLQDLMHQDNLNNINFGIIISENVGVSNVIKGANRVNPFNIPSTQQAIFHSFNMKQEEKIIKYKKDIEYVKKNTTYTWIKAFLMDLKRTATQHTKQLGIGLNLGFCLMKFSSNFQRLPKNDFLDAYKNSNNRLIFLNYEGTLQQESEDVTKNVPESRILKILSNLTSDPKNSVFIVSGNTRKLLQEWFSKIKDLNLAAEQGFFYTQFDKDEKDVKETYNKDVNQTILWKELFHINDWSWKDRGYQILEAFTEKTEGSKIIEKDAILKWDYLNCDIYFGNMQAYEISTHLNNIFEHSKLFINHARDYLEIKPKQLTKGYFLSTVMKVKYAKNECPDFIFALGEDDSDEEMFKYLNSIKDQLTQFNENIKTYPCTIGHKPSAAKFFLNEIPEVLEYLESLNKPIEKYQLLRKTLRHTSTLEKGLRKKLSLAGADQSASNSSLNFLAQNSNLSSSQKQYMDNSSIDY